MPVANTRAQVPHRCTSKLRCEALPGDQEKHDRPVGVVGYARCQQPCFLSRGRHKCPPAYRRGGRPANTVQERANAWTDACIDASPARRLPTGPPGPGRVGDWGGSLKPEAGVAPARPLGPWAPLADRPWRACWGGCKLGSRKARASVGNKRNEPRKPEQTRVRANPKRPESTEVSEHQTHSGLLWRPLAYSCLLWFAVGCSGLLRTNQADSC